MNRAGLTYAEILMALVILAVALVPLLSQFYIGFQGSRVGRDITIATNLAEDLIDEIRSKRFDENPPPSQPVPLSKLGPDANESRYNLPAVGPNFDDVDDYHGLNEDPPKDLAGTALTDFSGFIRSVTVNYVTIIGSGDTWQDYDRRTDNKKVLVMVAMANDSISPIGLELVVTNY